MKQVEEVPLNLDELDINIIKRLQTDGRTSYTDISEELGITVGTVRNRVQRLIENQILKIVGVVNPFKTGSPSVTIFGMKVRHQKLDYVIKKLVEIPEIRFVAAATGVYDLYVEVITSSNEELYGVMKNGISPIDGIESVESSLILEIFKQSYDWGVGSQSSR
ncbi:Lrp/AsnC family transcriptional regulator [Bacillus massiliglaciei]|uniref:Lrp/AsnC family transcriptional regulator n=1 Tax=Bacillus massiliglaciei TaxID=1816693 RepID=UPI000AAA09BF|nr:Lrp/AsnC family transcriptional regulator [Bacillus massiliglaciei]